MQIKEQPPVFNFLHPGASPDPLSSTYPGAGDLRRGTSFSDESFQKLFD